MQNYILKNYMLQIVFNFVLCSWCYWKNNDVQNKQVLVAIAFVGYICSHLFEISIYVPKLNYGFVHQLSVICSKLIPISFYL